VRRRIYFKKQTKRFEEKKVKIDQRMKKKDHKLGSTGGNPI